MENRQKLTEKYQNVPKYTETDAKIHISQQCRNPAFYLCIKQQFIINSMMKTNMISIWMCTFTLMACGASKETVVNQEKADWGQLSFRETLQTQVVPMSEANLAIPITALHDLPPAAVFHQSSGQANVSVRLVHDTLFVESRCDSLMQLVYQYENQINQWQQERHNQIVHTERDIGWKGSIIGTVFWVSLLLFFGWIWIKNKSPGR